MRRKTLFTIRINSEERKAIVALAEQLQRSQSDAVRFVVTEAVKTLQEQKFNEQIKIQQEGTK